MVVVVDTDVEESFGRLCAVPAEKVPDDLLVAFEILKSRSLVVVVLHSDLLEDLLFLPPLQPCREEYIHCL